MNQMIIIKGKLVGLGLKQQLKSRQTNSSIGYFDLNGKAIVPYNLKQYLRAMSAPRLQMELSKATRPENKGSQSSYETSESFALKNGQMTQVFELPWTVTAGLAKSSSASKASIFNKNSQDYPILPHEIKKESFQKNTWTWLSWSMKNNSPVTGRIARSLQRAGICVLIGGFTAFLPYKEYSIRNKAICAKEAELQSFQILNMKRSNLNFVLSKDRVTYKYDREWMH